MPCARVAPAALVGSLLAWEGRIGFGGKASTAPAAWSRLRSLRHWRRLRRGPQPILFHGGTSVVVVIFACK
jgi:hypothetical protein